MSLRTLPGIGPTKLELYGDEILAVIAEAATVTTPDPATESA